MIKIRNIGGAIITLISYYIWIFSLLAVSFYFFSEEELIFGSVVVGSTISSNLIFNWFIAGVLPVFFFAGQYIVCNNSTEREEKINYLRDVKITLLGFLLWLLIIMGFSLFQINIDSRINFGGGYLIILIIYSKFHITSPH
ncbi:MAG: hypothetical protein SCH39_00285 [Methanosarcinales archaeon]|nr:hypothetical protein [Methanosarcinales archaeon]